MERTSVAPGGRQHVDVVEGDLAKAERLVGRFFYCPSTIFPIVKRITWTTRTVPWVWCIGGTRRSLRHSEFDERSDH